MLCGMPQVMSQHKRSRKMANGSETNVDGRLTCFFYAIIVQHPANYLVAGAKFATFVIIRAYNVSDLRGHLPLYYFIL